MIGQIALKIGHPDPYRMANEASARGLLLLVDCMAQESRPHRPIKTAEQGVAAMRAIFGA